MDIQALQFSLLAGRLFFKGVRYHGQNETILVHDGYITWRYWLRHVQKLEDEGTQGAFETAGSEKDESSGEDSGRKNPRDGETGGDTRSRDLPCRVLVKSRGVEWFIYNRSPAYDAIFQSMRGEEGPKRTPTDSSSQQEPKQSRRSPFPENAVGGDLYSKDEALSAVEQKEEKDHEFDGIKEEEDSASISTSSSTQDLTATTNALPGLLNILPIRIECNKGAIVMGNRNTRSIFTAKFDGAYGQIDARRSRAVDQYKQTFDFDFIHPVIEFKHNRDYAESHMHEGAKISSRSAEESKGKTSWSEHFQFRKQVVSGWTSIRDFLPYRKGSVESLTHPHLKSAAGDNIVDDNAGIYAQNRWLGLTRYLDDDDDFVEQERWKAVEYGEFPTIVDSPAIFMSFYWDIPGLIPNANNSTRNPPPGSEVNINGDTPPDWGIDLKVRGGTINYGPWADRQRVDMQASFFPTLYKDATPAARLLPGQPRVSTMLKVVVEIEEQTILRVPTREDSKDWRWKGRTMDPAGKSASQKKSKAHTKGNKSKNANTFPRERPFGWLDVKVMPDSTVSFAMDLLARANGYRNRVDLDLKGLEISSSVNHGLLWRSQSQVISCDLSNPLGWNTLRQWHIDIQDNGLELFILRDHMFLLSDLINDWTSGPPGDFHTFVPFDYSIGLRFTDFRLYVNANDSNLINNPSDPNDNTFIVIWGQNLRADLVIPARTFRPACNKVTFDIEAQDGGLKLLTSARNTQHTFLDNFDVAALKDLAINGSYNYFTTISPSLTDILLLNVHGVAPTISLYGFLIRYLMKVKDNYFGDDIHFRTWEEYLDQVKKVEERSSEDTNSGQHSRLSNDLDVILGITAEKSCAMLPAHLYSSKENVRLEISSLVGDLRITNYYMDLAVSSSPIAISHTPHSEVHQDSPETYSNTQVFIDGFEVLGHRLFGLPPTEPTYVCNWDFDIGSVTGETSIDFLHCLAMSVRCFALSFEDAENALPPLNPPSIHDVTFLRARTRPILLGLRVENAIFLLSTKDIKVDYKDWAGSLFSDRLHVLVPDLIVAVADAHGGSIDRGNLQHVSSTHAYIKTAIELNRVKRKLDFKGDRQLQQGHVALHDSRSHRTPWLILEPDKISGLGASIRPTKSRPPAMPFPHMPEPVSALDSSALDEPSVTSSKANSVSSRSASSRKSSFITSAFSRQGKAKTRDSSSRAHQSQRRLGNRPNRDPVSTRHQSTADDLSGKEHGLRSQQKPRVRNAPGEDVASQASFARSGLAFSSPYKRPYFPLLATKPNTRDVPNLPNILPSDFVVNDADALEYLKSQASDQDVEHCSFMVNVTTGFKAFCTPEALILVTQLLAQFETNDTVALLDDLQIDTMTDVLNARKTREDGSQITDVRVYVSWARVRFVSTRSSGSKGVIRREHYNINTENLAATIRSSSMISKAPQSPESSTSSIHVLLDQLACSASESMADAADDQAIISLSITNPVIWMSHGETSAADLQFDMFQLTSASRKVDHISALIRQSIVLSEDLARRFSNIEKERKSRLRLLVLLLTIEGKDLPDPPFLTKASYVLRSGSRHLRTNDSWKMMSCLRYIHQCLPAHSRNKVHAQLVNKLASCPLDASCRVIANFEHWRTWDLDHVRSSDLMRKVYGRMLSPPAQDLERSMPLKANLRAGKIQVLVEPGPHQNEIATEKLVIGMALNQRASTLTTVSSTSESPSVLTSTIQAHCAVIALRLHWALLDLLKNVVETLQATRSPSPTKKSSIPVPRPSPSNSRFHVAVSAETTILSLDTENIKAISLCRGLKSSVILLQDDKNREGSSMSLLVNADAAKTEVKRHSTPLSLYNLRLPRVFGSKLSNSDGCLEHAWKFVGSGQDVSFEILANPLELIEAADSLLEDEIPRINHWAKSLQPATSLQKSRPAPHKQAGLLRVHVALFLDSYLISLAVLPSLTYQIRGTGAGSSIRSGLRHGHDLRVDFDLKNHAHVFKTQGNDTFIELSTFQIPPINGRLGLDLSPVKKSVLLNMLVESIVFDASAVHAILSTVIRPEIISLGSSIDQGISSVKERYEQMFDFQESNKELVALEQILYSGFITVAGLAVHANTSDSMTVAQGAQLKFKMGRINLKTTNREPNSEAAMKFPELEVRLDSIQLNLLRSDKLDLRQCGEVSIGAILKSTSKLNDEGEPVRAYQIRSDGLKINVYAETASVVVAILGHLQDTLKTVDLSHEVQNLRKLRHPRLSSGPTVVETAEDNQVHNNAGMANLFNAMYSLELTNICVIWRIGDSIPISPGRKPEDLILSFTKIDLATRKHNAARLLIQNFQLQMTPSSDVSTERSLNSALLPEVVFNVAYVSTAQDRRLAFQAVGKSLDLRLTSQFILPASDLRRSIALSVQQVRTATADWNASTTVTDGQTKKLLGNKKLASLLIDADFAGAVVYIQGRSHADSQSLALNVLRGGRLPQHGRYNQFTPENASSSSTTLRAPGIAFKVEYKNATADEKSLNAEMKVDASSNTLYPTVVPLVMEISSSVKDIVNEPEDQEQAVKPNIPQPKFLGDERLRGADPSAIFGNCRLNLGLRICRQEFSLSCQPIARVAATARFEDIYLTVNTVQSQEHGRFFTISAAFTSLQVSVQHVYSRESTGSFDVDSIVVSLMNSKHVSTDNGIFAILKVSPMKAQINGKQAQDFLLFREIWVPPEIRQSPSTPVQVPASESQAFIVQRYQQIAAAGAFPWNATISIAELDVQLDLGQSLGKSAFIISDFWISSKKDSDWEQNLCLGFNKMAVNSTGRMSGFVELQHLKVRTSIQWPIVDKAHSQTPLVQASLAFDHLRIKAAFDYQAFLITDVTSFEFIMYNVRDPQIVSRDRLVGVLGGDRVQVFCTTTSASQVIALYQAFQRLYQEKLAAYETSLRDIEKFLRRKSSINPMAIRAAAKRQEEAGGETTRSPLRLQTDVVVTLRAVNLGAFPSTFFDNQIFKLEALDASARFAVVLNDDKIHSNLGMTLGQLRIALAGITRASVPRTLGEVSVADVVASATGSRGGTILKVPTLVATMETWQSPESTHIDYIFKSSFQGKVDVGWNYSRISYIRGMWTSHARALAQRLGKPLPPSAVQITGGPRPQVEGEDGSQVSEEGENQKITAVVTVPLSKYQYTALQPPIIETPQLRDMGEATPPLEWIGLHRDRLPNLTHQIVIITLLEVAKEVDDAYSRILGSS